MTLASSLADLVRHAEQTPRALPASCYLDPEFFQAELDQVLRPGWHAIARIDDLPNSGDFRSLDLFGEPIVLVRDDTQRLRAFSRICLHRACIIVEGEGNTKRFTCPFHRWGYGLDGRLTAAPLMEQVPHFEREKQSLPELALEEWLGFVLVSLDPTPAPLSSQLKEMEEILRPRDFASYQRVGTLDFESPWNWKVLVENFIESYHHLGTHLATAQPVYPAEDTYAMDLDTAGTLLDNPKGDGSPGAWIAQVFPAFLFFATLEQSIASLIWYEMQIDAIDHFHLRLHLLMPKDLAANEPLTEILLEAFNHVHQEDIATCNLVQRGLSGRLFKPTALATQQEEGLIRFHRYLTERMTRADR